jgi:hypothetical protein
LDDEDSALVIIRAAEVIAALGADQLAVVAGQTMAAGGADLAVMIDRGSDRSGLRTTLSQIHARSRTKIRDEIGVEGAGTLGQHG